MTVEMPCTEACRRMFEGVDHCYHCEKELAKLYIAIQRVRHFHNPVVSETDIVCGHCIDPYGAVRYPCETIELLDRDNDA